MRVRERTIDGGSMGTSGRTDSRSSLCRPRSRADQRTFASRWSTRPSAFSNCSPSVGAGTFSFDLPKMRRMVEGAVKEAVSGESWSVNY